MITLLKDNFHCNTSLKELVHIDKKANILECFRLINMEVTSQYTKAQLALIYDMFLPSRCRMGSEQNPQDRMSYTVRFVVKKTRRIYGVYP